MTLSLLGLPSKSGVADGTASAARTAAQRRVRARATSGARVAARPGSAANSSSEGTRAGFMTRDHRGCSRPRGLAPRTAARGAKQAKIANEGQGGAMSSRTSAGAALARDVATSHHHWADRRSPRRHRNMRRRKAHAAIRGRRGEERGCPGRPSCFFRNRPTAAFGARPRPSKTDPGVSQRETRPSRGEPTSAEPSFASFACFAPVACGPQGRGAPSPGLDTRGDQAEVAEEIKRLVELLRGPVTTE